MKSFFSMFIVLFFKNFRYFKKSFLVVSKNINSFVLNYKTIVYNVYL